MKGIITLGTPLEYQTTKLPFADHKEIPDSIIFSWPLAGFFNLYTNGPIVPIGASTLSSETPMNGTLIWGIFLL